MTKQFPNKKEKSPHKLSVSMKYQKHFKTKLNNLPEKEYSYFKTGEAGQDKKILKSNYLVKTLFKLRSLRCL